MKEKAKKGRNLKEKFVTDLKREEKGITLIALVVTIIVLIILAGISISLVLGDNGIITKAKDARENFLRAADEEETKLNELYAEINERTGGSSPKGSTWTYNHAAQTVTNGTLTLKIGDYVNDTATQTIDGFDGKWRVLGAENGKLLLVTNTCWAPFDGAETPYGDTYPVLKLEGLAGWNNGVSRLKAVGEAYANSSTKFENGRSIKIEDIDRITGYNPVNTGKNDPEKNGTGTIYGQGNPYQYGNKVTYKIISGKVNWATDYDENNPEAATWNATTESTFKPLGVDTPLAEGETFTVDKSDFYMYYATTLTENSSDSTTEGLDSNGAAYDMLFKVQGPPYWLASPCVYASEYIADWYFRSVNSGYVTYCGVWGSYFGSDGNTFGVRPVVSLKSDITPQKVTEDEADRNFNI